MKCRHIWSVDSQREQLSAWDQMKDRLISSTNLTPEYFRHDVIVTYKCANCPAEKVERV